MKTIERLCKCKDVVDLLYMYVHRAFTKEVILELTVLAKQHISCFSQSLSFPGDAHIGFENCCFNWRDLALNWSKQPIYHVSFKQSKTQIIENVYTPTPY